MDNFDLFRRQLDDRSPILVFHVLLTAQQDRFQHDGHDVQRFGVFREEGFGDERVEESKIAPWLHAQEAQKTV